MIIEQIAYELRNDDEIDGEIWREFARLYPRELDALVEALDALAEVIAGKMIGRENYIPEELVREVEKSLFPSLGEVIINVYISPERLAEMRAESEREEAEHSAKLAAMTSEERAEYDRRMQELRKAVKEAE